jgi:hypothetical protein
LRGNFPSRVLPQRILQKHPGTERLTRDGDTADYERLLTREGRASLPLGKLLLLYFDPFALFMDASRGPAWRRERALSYNRARRPLLLAYMRRWTVVSACCYLGIASSEALAAQAPVFLIPAVGFGIACSVALVVTVCTCAAYLLLGLNR